MRNEGKYGKLKSNLDSMLFVSNLIKKKHERMGKTEERPKGDKKRKEKSVCVGGWVLVCVGVCVHCNKAWKGGGVNPGGLHANSAD